VALPQKLEADTRCHAKLPTDQELLYSGCVQCGSTVRASTLKGGAPFHDVTRSTTDLTHRPVGPAGRTSTCSVARRPGRDGAASLIVTTVHVL
jgi:hypothetical protein